MTASTAPATATDEHLAAIVSRRGESARAWAAALEAFDRLYDRHAPGLLAFVASRAPRSDRDDLHQLAWLRAWDRSPVGFRGGSFRGWLFEIARNAIIDHARKKAPEALGDAEARLEGRDGPPDAGLAERERAEALRRCLERLSAQEADLVRARLGGDDYEQICPRLGITAARAHKLFHQAKAQLKTCVERALS